MFQNILNDPKRIFGLDVMRTIAILMVLSSHCLWIYPESNSVLVQVLHLFGFLGVEIFFVLSGFLIGKILYTSFLATDFSFYSVKTFLKRRWFRTFPNYFLILLLNILIAGIIGYKIDSLWKYFFFLQNFSEAMPAFFPESWSLSVEEWIYLILPFCLFALSFIKKNKSILFLSVVIFLIIFFQISKIIYNATSEFRTVSEWNLHLKSVVIYRLDSILYGVLASWIYFNLNSKWRKNQLNCFLIGSFGMLFLNFGIGKISLSPENLATFYNIFYTPLTSISIALFLPILAQWETSNSWVKIPIVFTSVTSYSIYLLHYSVILQLMKHFIPTENLSKIELLIFTFFYLVVTFFMSALFYFFYEKPMMNFRNEASQKE